MKYLNIACGSNYIEQPDWVNLDYKRISLGNHEQSPKYSWKKYKWTETKYSKIPSWKSYR